MSAGDIPVLEDLGSAECPGVPCGRTQGDGWQPSTAVLVRVGTYQHILCPACGRAYDVTGVRALNPAPPEGVHADDLGAHPDCPRCHGTGRAPNAQFRCACRWEGSAGRDEAIEAGKRKKEKPVVSMLEAVRKGLDAQFGPITPKKETP